MVNHIVVAETSKALYTGTKCSEIKVRLKMMSEAKEQKIVMVASGILHSQYALIRPRSG